MYETYQDGTGAGPVVDKERGLFRIHVCTYHKEKEIMCAPHCNGTGGRESGRRRGGTSRGCYVAVELVGWLVGWLACAGELEMPGEGGPICAEAGTFQGFCLGAPVHR